MGFENNEVIKMYKHILVLFLILATTTIQAELPFETRHKHSFFVTSGMKFDKPLNDKLQNIFTFNYAYDNKISGGISYRDHKYELIYNENYNYNTGFLNEGEGYTYQMTSYVNLYAQVKPLNLLNLNSPVSFSLFVVMQDISDEKIIIANTFFYKKFILNKRHSIQPIISIGYGDISRVSNMPPIIIGVAFIYAYRLDKHTSVILTPQLNRYWGNNTYTIQVGISHGL